jgi:hypothetical protein
VFHGVLHTCFPDVYVCNDLVDIEKTQCKGVCAVDGAKDKSPQIRRTGHVMCSPSASSSAKRNVSKWFRCSRCKTVGAKLSAAFCVVALCDQ